MPDFSMCPNDHCKLAPSCRRSPKSGTLANDRWQVWMIFEPDADGLDCLAFMPQRTTATKEPRR